MHSPTLQGGVIDAYPLFLRVLRCVYKQFDFLIIFDRAKVLPAIRVNSPTLKGGVMDALPLFLLVWFVSTSQFVFLNNIKPG